MEMSFIMPIKGQRQQTHLSSFKMFHVNKKKLMYKTLWERDTFPNDSVYGLNFVSNDGLQTHSLFFLRAR